jgi:hypothetical protein
VRPNAFREFERHASKSFLFSSFVLVPAWASLEDDDENEDDFKGRSLAYRCSR